MDSGGADRRLLSVSIWVSVTWFVSTVFIMRHRETAAEIQTELHLEAEHGSDTGFIRKNKCSITRTEMKGERGGTFSRLRQLLLWRRVLGDFGGSARPGSVVRVQRLWSRKEVGLCLEMKSSKVKTGVKIVFKSGRSCSSEGLILTWCNSFRSDFNIHDMTPYVLKFVVFYSEEKHK